MGILFFWAIPSWIIGIALSSRFRPVVSFVGIMATFVVTMLAAHVFSIRDLFASVEGMGVTMAQAMAGLVLIRALIPRKHKGAQN